MKKEQEEINKKSIKEKVADVMQLPKELVLEIPKITGFGNNQLLLEACKGIIEYTDSVIKLKTKSGNFVVNGHSLEIKAITKDDVFIEGIIKSMHWSY